MHRIQKEILRLSEEKNLGLMTLRQIGLLVGEQSPQKIKHHLDQLEKRGLIRVDKAKNTIKRVKRGLVESPLRNAQLIAIPILGSATAGPPTSIGEENIEGYLRVSSTFLHSRSQRKLFALRVSGPSMNRAKIDDKLIEDGDYVLIDSDDRFPNDGDIILSIIDGFANIKRFFVDKPNRQIALVSDSTRQYPPIYIHESDDFMVNGKVIQVIKKPRFTETVTRLADVQIEGGSTRGKK